MGRETGADMPRQVEMVGIQMRDADEGCRTIAAAPRDGSRQAQAEARAVSPSPGIVSPSAVSPPLSGGASRPRSSAP